jgi:AcrR family transcriptional regulator
MPQRSQTPATTASPGRPRDPNRDQAILRATLELMAVRGFELGIEEVAERAGVAKTTIYRRFPSKEELVIAALETVAVPQPAPDTGSVRADLIEFGLRRLEEAETVATPLVGMRLLSDLWQYPKLLAIFSERILAPARAPLVAIVERGIARGELRDDIDRDLIVDSLYGGLVYRTLISGDLSVVARDLEAFLDAAIEGVGRRERSGP